jgi:hypothetical protein
VLDRAAEWQEVIVTNRILSKLIFGDTENLRTFFALCSFGWGLWALTDANFAKDHASVISFVQLPQLGILFFIHCAGVLYGVNTGRYNVILLFIEGLLGAFLWVGVGIAEAIGQGTAGPTLFGGMCALFLLIRYPTHYPRRRNG